LLTANATHHFLWTHALTDQGETEAKKPFHIYPGNHAFFGGRGRLYCVQSWFVLTNGRQQQDLFATARLLPVSSTHHFPEDFSLCRCNHFVSKTPIYSLKSKPEH
jgi:hypothetical protein